MVQRDDRAEWELAAERMVREAKAKAGAVVTGLIQIHVTIEGVTPLLCNRFTDAAQMAVSSATRSALLGDKGTPLEQAATKLYIGHDGQPMIPQPNLFRCLIDAGKYFKYQKSKITTQKSSLLPACVEILGLELPIEHREQPLSTRSICP